ncbi:MAG: hypothetical protein J6P44_05190 [Bacteroidales bacterium]|nr:hypothetical protein [Bacteroidales bacterium]
MKNILKPLILIYLQVRINNTLTLLFGLVYFVLNGYGQDRVFEGTLLDISTNKPVTYAYISINHSLYGTVSDEQGRFAIRYSTLYDTLCISNFEYLAKDIVIKDAKSKIYLTHIENTLEEVNVEALSPQTILIRALDSSNVHNWKKGFTCQMETFASLYANDSLKYLLYSDDLYKIKKRFGYKNLTDYKNMNHQCMNLDTNNTVYYWERILFGGRYRSVLNSKFTKKAIQNNKVYKKLSLQIITKDSADDIYIITAYYKDTSYCTTKYYIKADNFSFICIEDFYMGKGMKSDSIVTVEMFSGITFNMVDNKYFPTNYSMMVKYYKIDKPSVIYEEKYLVNTTRFNLQENKFSRKKQDCNFLLHQYFQSIRDNDGKINKISTFTEDDKVKTFIEMSDNRVVH